jgi:hypothetical protein
VAPATASAGIASINSTALVAMFRQIIANNRTGGRRKLKRGM